LEYADNIAVQGSMYPTDGDLWTYGTGWTDVIGSSATNPMAPKVGTSCIRGTADATNHCLFNRTFSRLHVDGINGYHAVELWVRMSSAPLTNRIRLY
jgi:hypothetical protein